MAGKKNRLITGMRYARIDFGRIVFTRFALLHKTQYTGAQCVHYVVHLNSTCFLNLFFSFSEFFVRFLLLLLHARL